MPEDIIIKIGAIDNVTGVVKTVNKSIQTLSNGTQIMTSQTEKFRKGILKSSESIKQVTTGIHKFKFEWLGVMFFSMQVSRVMNKALGSIFDSYMKITAGGTRLAESVTYGAAAFEYLKYTMGEALIRAIEPLIPIFVGIIETFANLIEQHPWLVWGLIGLAIAAFVGFAIAQFALFAASLSIMGISFGGIVATITGGIAVLTGAFGAFFAFLLANPIILVITGIIAVIILLWQNWDAVCKAMGDAWKWLCDLFKPLTDAMGAAWQWLGEKVKWVWDVFIKPVFDLIMAGLRAIQAAFRAVAGLFGTEGSIATGGKGPTVGGVPTGGAITTIRPLGTKQLGGSIPQTGMYMMHQGEYVTPAGETTNVGGITVNVNNPTIRSDRDIQELANKVGQVIMSKMGRHTPISTMYGV